MKEIGNRLLGVFDPDICGGSIAGDSDVHACNNKAMTPNAKKEARVTNNTMSSK